MSLKEFKIAPEDPRNFVYIIFYWLGIGTLLPWNFFISVSEYWKYKWRTVDEESQLLEASSPQNNTLVLNDLQKNWSSHLAVASMVPNVTMLLLNASFGHLFKTQPRLLVSLCFVIVLFTVTLIFAKVDTDPWQSTFYVVTLITVVLININAAIFQGGLLGIAGKFPPRYIGGVFSGQALGGIFASATNLIFLAMGADVVNAAFFSFLIAVIFLGTALAGYVAVTKSDFFQHFANEDHLDNPEDKKLMESKEFTPITPKVAPLKVLLKISFYVASVFLVFTVTLGCFPAITVLIVSTDLETGSAWSTKYFIPVVCFLLFNIGDYLGRLLAEYFKWPRPGRSGMLLLFVISLLRFAFVPLFILCNANPNNREMTDVVFANDYFYILLMILFSMSNGYVASVCMMSAPQICQPEEQQTAASLMVAFLGLGLGAGSALSNLFVQFV